jgi:hypothetical protein
MTTSRQIDEEEEMRSNRSTHVARYRDAAGAEHSVILLAIKQGWRILDQNATSSKVVDTLTDPQDSCAHAEAVARDYAQQAVLPAWALQ